MRSLVELLPHGACRLIADKLGIGTQAVSKALTKQKPGHPAVIEALRMARDSGALEAAQSLKSISAASSEEADS